MTVIDPAERSIRSYVRRAGRITRSQRQALESLWPQYGIEFSEQRLVLPSEFSALKLEIGFGNGDAVISMAAADPQSLYIGIEVHAPGIGHCLHRLAQQRVTNLRLLRHDAIEVLQQMIAPASLDRVLLFFPDPWPKKRHHKRRIVNPCFRDLIFRSLKPGAEIHIATDWQNYAESIAAQFLADRRFVNRGDAAGYIECPQYRPRTRFEQRGQRLGHDVWDLLFAKTTDSSSIA